MPPKRDFLPHLVGCLSTGAAGNPTVEMIEAAFRHHGLHWRYINTEVSPAGLGDAVRGLRAMGYRGFNCSLPHKVTVIPHLDGLGQSAEVMGAVNCVVRRGDQFIGENTDGKGFLRSLQSLVDPRGKRVVVYGAGGAARAIAVELGLAGVGQLTVVNRSAERGEALLKILRERLQLNASLVRWEGDHAIPADTDVVINSTSIGLYDAEARVPLAVDSLRPGMVVADVIFSPPQTRLLRDARARGCRTLDGLGMIVNQGVIGVQYWTGIEPDARVMRVAVAEALGVPVEG
jgi:shikimate dehydrogenase